jgi:hypothetical protein
MGEECLTLPTLQYMAYEREWTGKPSTTQSLSGVRCEWLKLKTPYFINPQERAFALLGTRHHGRLESVTKKMDVLSEEFMQDSEMKGTLDLLEPDRNNPGSYILSDYKTGGAYKAVQVLGLEVNLIPDPSGAVYKRDVKDRESGAIIYAKGSPKMIKEVKQNLDKADTWEWAMQVNRYRLFVEDVGFIVSRMRVQLTVRDGGLAATLSRGVDQKIYMVKIPRLEDDYVRSYFRDKSRELVEAMAGEKIPPPCSTRETFDGAKCAKFCEVWSSCDVGLEARKEK